MPEKSDATRLALLEQADEHHRERLHQQESTLNRLVASFEKLVLLEERHIETKEALNRAFKTLKDHDGRITSIETKMPQLIESRGWVIAGVIGIVTLVSIAIFKFVFVPQQQPQSYHQEPPAKVSGP